MSETLTLADVPDTDASALPPRHYLAELVIQNRDRLSELVPSTILPNATLESLGSGLLARKNLILVGPSGSGKTNLALDVMRLMLREVYAVADCPIHEDPLTLASDPCPACAERHKGAEPKDIPVVKMRLAEGHGYARIQGSPEIFPDQVTGTLNLKKLEEIGDPLSPLVFEAGKLLQAHRGVLLVDEVGKLPKSTQNVLLQALQERHVSPARSRESFPADFVVICTSNIFDLDNINQPLNDRLSSIHLGYPSEHGINLDILDVNLRKYSPRLFIPQAFLDTSAFILEAWRAREERMYELSEVGSNRVMVDIVERAEGYALLKGRDTVSEADLKRAALDSCEGRIRARGLESYVQNRLLVRRFLDEVFDAELARGARAYWCRFYQGVLDGDEKAGRNAIEGILKAAAGPAPSGGGFDRFKEYVGKSEAYTGEIDEAARLSKVAKLMVELGIDKDFDCS